MNAAQNTIRGVIQVPEGYPELQGAVIYVKGAKADVLKPVVIKLNQRDFKFHPEILVAPLGSTLHISNQDPSIHTIIAHGGPLKGLNVTQIPKSKVFSRLLNSLGHSEILCGIHSQMKAQLLVIDSNEYAISDTKGSFKIQSKAAFPFQIHVWHEILDSAIYQIEKPEDLKKLSPIALRSAAQQ